jgi:hypothetical protein
MIDKGIRKEMLWIKFESEEVDGQTVCLNLNFCRFLEGIDFFEYLQFVCINVILLIECIFTGVDPLWSCFERSLNLIFCCNLEMTFYYPKNMMIRNIDFISLMNTNDQKKFELSVDEKEHFSSSGFVMEIEKIFELLIGGNDCIFILNVSENSDSQLFSGSESESESENEEEKEKIVNKMEEIREFLKLSGGSKSEECSSFSKMKSTEIIEIDASVEIIRRDDFYSWE